MLDNPILQTKAKDVKKPVDSTEIKPVSKEFLDNLSQSKSTLPAPSQDISFELLTVPMLMDLPELTWTIEDVLVTGGMILLYGPSGVGKSFVSLSMALAIATGTEWMGKKSIQGPVVYYAGEGLHGYRTRIPAYLSQNNLTEVSDLYLLRGSFSLSSLDEVMKFCLYLKSANISPALVVIDTLARTYAGDENSVQDMNTYIRGVDLIREETGAAVLLVHHTGKNNKQERGSSALRAAADVVMSCEAISEETTPLVILLKCDKNKDGDSFKDIFIELAKVLLPAGKSSLVAVLTSEQLKIQESEKHAETIIEILTEFGDKGASYTDLREKFEAKTKKSKSTFSRALRAFKESPKVRTELRGKYDRYFINATYEVSVSSGCQIGSMTQGNPVSHHPPSYGGDTDTTQTDTTKQKTGINAHGDASPGFVAVTPTNHTSPIKTDKMDD